MKFVEQIRSTVRNIMAEIAMLINEASHGKVTPSQITAISTVLHVLIAAAIIQDLYAPAALMLAVFGLMDALDGALARLQKSESELGVILDATTDRIKETIIFSAIIYVFADQTAALLALYTALALGGSIIVSYVRAKAETALVARSKKLSSNEVNKMHRGGLFSYDVRTSVLIIGLLVDRLDIAIIVIMVGVWWTMIWRSREIWQTLSLR